MAFAILERECFGASAGASSLASCLSEATGKSPGEPLTSLQSWLVDQERKLSGLGFSLLFGMSTCNLQGANFDFVRLAALPYGIRKWGCIIFFKGVEGSEEKSSCCRLLASLVLDITRFAIGHSIGCCTVAQRLPSSQGGRVQLRSYRKASLD